MSLDKAIWASLRSRGCVVTTSAAAAYTHDKTSTLFLLGTVLGTSCRSAFVDRDEPIDLGREAVVIVSSHAHLTSDMTRAVTLAGCRTDIDTEADRAVLSSAARSDCAERDDLGFVFWGQTKDEHRRYVLWLSGNGDTGIHIATVWVTKSCLSAVPCPAGFPEKPVCVTVAPYVQPAAGNVSVSQLKAKIVCGNLEWNMRKGLWVPREMPPRIGMTYVRGDLSTILVNEVPITQIRKATFELLAVLVRAKQEKRWMTLSDMTVSVSGDCGAALHAKLKKAVSARLSDIRKMDDRIVSERGPARQTEYQLNAIIEIINA